MQEIPRLSNLSALPDEARKVQVFVGDWKVEGTLTCQGKPLKVKGAWKATSVAADTSRRGLSNRH